MPTRPQMPLGTFGGGLGDLLDEAGVGADAPQSGPTCPSCGASILPGAVICVECGFNSATGKKIETDVDPNAIDKTAGLSDAEKMIVKADKELRASPLDQTSFGDSWDAWLIAAGLGVGGIFVAYFVLVYMKIFAEFMAYEPPLASQNIAKYVLLGGTITGFMIAMLAWLRVTGAAFYDHKGHGFACLTTFGIYAQFYAVWHWSKYFSDYFVFWVGVTLMEFSTWFYYDTMDWPWENNPPYIRLPAFLIYLIANRIYITVTLLLIARAFQEERKRTHGIIAAATLGWYSHVYALIRWADQKWLYITLAIASGFVGFARILGEQSYTVEFQGAPLPMVGVIFFALAVSGYLLCYTAWIRTVAIGFQNKETKLHGILALSIPFFYAPVYHCMNWKRLYPWFFTWLTGFVLFLLSVILLSSMDFFDIPAEAIARNEQAIAIQARRELRNAPAVREGEVRIEDVTVNSAATRNAQAANQRPDQPLWVFDVTFTNTDTGQLPPISVTARESWSIFGGRYLTPE